MNNTELNDNKLIKEVDRNGHHIELWELNSPYHERLYRLVRVWDNGDRKTDELFSNWHVANNSYNLALAACYK